jgi:hypothetical protein
VGSGSAGAVRTVTFPRRFPNQSFVAVVTPWILTPPSPAYVYDAWVQNRDETSFEVAGSVSNGDVTSWSISFLFGWLAIGY